MAKTPVGALHLVPHLSHAFCDVVVSVKFTGVHLVHQRCGRGPKHLVAHPRTMALPELPATGILSFKEAPELKEAPRPSHAYRCGFCKCSVELGELDWGFSIEYILSSAADAAMAPVYASASNAVNERFLGFSARSYAGWNDEERLNLTLWLVDFSAPATVSLSNISFPEDPRSVYRIEDISFGSAVAADEQTDIEQYAKPAIVTQANPQSSAFDEILIDDMVL